MTDLTALFVGLLDDGAALPPASRRVADAVVAHHVHRKSWYAPLMRSLVVPDQALRQAQGAEGQARGAEGQAQGAEGQAQSLDVSVVNTSGAGGLISLAQRDLSGVRVIAVESALRDLDDLAGNAARVVSAARELDESVQVFVEFPYAPGWERAVEEVEAGGLLGLIRIAEPTHASADELARQLSALIEADLPFKLSGRSDRYGLPTLLTAVDGLIEGAEPADVAEILLSRDEAAIADWDAPQVARIRRRLHSVHCASIADAVAELDHRGLLSKPE